MITTTIVSQEISFIEEILKCGVDVVVDGELEIYWSRTLVSTIWIGYGGRNGGRF